MAQERHEEGGLGQAVSHPQGQDLRSRDLEVLCVAIGNLITYHRVDRLDAGGEGLLSPFSLFKERDDGCTIEVEQWRRLQIDAQIRFPRARYIRFWHAQSVSYAATLLLAYIPHYSLWRITLGISYDRPPGRG